MIKYVVVLCCVTSALAKANTDQEVTDRPTQREIAKEFFDCVFNTGTCTENGEALKDTLEEAMEECESCSEEVKELTLQLFAVGHRLATTYFSEIQTAPEALSNGGNRGRIRGGQ